MGCRRARRRLVMLVGRAVGLAAVRGFGGMTKGVVGCGMQQAVSHAGTIAGIAACHAVRCVPALVKQS